MSAPDAASARLQPGRRSERVFVVKISPKPTYEQELLNAARTVARLQAKRRRLRRQLKETDAELRHERRILRALANRNDERRPDVAPSRFFAGATGHVAATGTDGAAAPPEATRTRDASGLADLDLDE